MNCKYIKNYNKRYIIFNDGRIFSTQRKILMKQEIVKSNKTSYNRITLSLNGQIKRFQVHQLIGKHFINNINNKPYINHIDNNGLNNHYTNLEWVTHSENMIHAERQGRLYSSQSKAGKISGAKSKLKKIISHNKYINRIFNNWKILKITNTDTKVKGICMCLKCNKHSKEMLLEPVINNRTLQCKSCMMTEYHKSIGHTQDYKKQKPIKNKPVVQYKNNILIQEFNTITEAEIYLNVRPGSSKIGQVCKHKYKSYKGFVWKYKNQVEDIV